MVGGGMREVDPSKGQSSSHSHLFKLCLCGDASGGKTATLTRFIQRPFDPKYATTHGVDFFVKTVEIDGDQVQLWLWDTAGKDRFRSATHSYYRGCHGIIICFDLTDRNTFNNVPDWIKELKNLTKKDTVFVLAGTKSDLEEERVVTSDEFNDLARQEELPHIEISALTGDNVFRLFEVMVEFIIKTKKESMNEVKSGPTLLGTMEVGGNSNSTSNNSPNKTQPEPDGATRSNTCGIL